MSESSEYIEGWNAFRTGAINTYSIAAQVEDQSKSIAAQVKCSDWEKGFLDAKKEAQCP